MARNGIVFVFSPSSQVMKMTPAWFVTHQMILALRAVGWRRIAVGQEFVVRERVGSCFHPEIVRLAGNIEWKLVIEISRLSGDLNESGVDVGGSAPLPDDRLGITIFHGY